MTNYIAMLNHLVNDARRYSPVLASGLRGHIMSLMEDDIKGSDKYEYAWDHIQNSSLFQSYQALKT